MPDKFSGDIDRRGGFLDYLVIILITIILVTFVIWANFTKLDLVTTGSGRLIASGQNKNVQAPVMGPISGFFGDPVSRSILGHSSHYSRRSGRTPWEPKSEGFCY